MMQKFPVRLRVTRPVRMFLVLLAGCIVVVPGVAGAARAVKMEELKVEGQVQKPQVSFILQRSSKINLDVDIQRFRPTFSEKNFEVIKQELQLFEQPR